jgi:hypothetical protein
MIGFNGENCVNVQASCPSLYEILLFDALERKIRGNFSFLSELSTNCINFLELSKLSLKSHEL